MSSVASTLGFKVNAYTKWVRTTDDYGKLILGPGLRNIIYLVVDQALYSRVEGDCNYRLMLRSHSERIRHRPYIQDIYQTRSRAISIKGMTTYAFNALNRGSEFSLLSLLKFKKIWMSSFTNARKTTKICARPTGEAHGLTYALPLCQSRLLNLFMSLETTGKLDPLFAAPMKDYVPENCRDRADWLFVRLYERCYADNYAILMAMVLGVLYGVCSHSLDDDLIFSTNIVLPASITGCGRLRNGIMGADALGTALQ